MSSVEVLVILGNTVSKVPEYKTLNASGCDLFCVSDVHIPPMTRVLLPTGLFIAIPVGWEGQIRPRSGLAFEEGLTVLNSPGTIDADYRGEVKILAINLGADLVRLRSGDRIAQLVIAPVSKAEFKVVSELPSTARDQCGFGHTGRRG